MALREELTKLHNEELRYLYFSSSKIKMINKVKENEMSRAFSMHISINMIPKQNASAYLNAYPL
jgi:hypothetical protein